MRLVRGEERIPFEISRTEIFLNTSLEQGDVKPVGEKDLRRSMDWCLNKNQK
jgi:hypothetical protein